MVATDSEVMHARLKALFFRVAVGGSLFRRYGFGADRNFRLAGVG